MFYGSKEVELLQFFNHRFIMGFLFSTYYISNDILTSDELLLGQRHFITLILSVKAWFDYKCVLDFQSIKI